MNRVVLKDIPLRSNPFSGWALRIHRVLFGLFLLQFVLVWARLWLPWPPPSSSWRRNRTCADKWDNPGATSSATASASSA